MDQYDLGQATYAIMLTAADLGRVEPVLGDWGPLRANFRRRVYEVPAPPLGTPEALP